MTLDYSRIWPYVIAALAVLVIYRRFRRSFGRQPLRPGRMGVRLGILVLLGCSLIPVALKSGQFLAADLLGLAAGAALGIWGADRTRYLTVAGQLHYVPHTYTGIAVSLLFIGRLVYRLVQIYGGNGTAGSPDTALAGPGMASPMMQSPLTVGLVAAVVGYYVSYYGLVLLKSKHIRPEDLEVQSTSTTAK
jgi:hypothetical protein